MNSYLYARWLFIRILAFGFAAAFLSLFIQIQGLIGPEGILPAGEFLAGVSKAYPGFFKFILAPSLLWINSGPTALYLLCFFGFAAAVLLLFNIWPRLNLFLCWLFYLSFVSVARNFSGFQSDGLMLESALLAIFAAPRGFRPGMGEKSPPSKIVIFLFWWLLFRLSFESGIGKVLSGDLDWRGLTAMNDYYVNCPFPTWIGWKIQQFPKVFHSLTVLFVFFCELVCPILILCGRKARLVAFLSWTVFQIGILLTGNYTYLNYNSIALALFLIDDDLFSKIGLKAPVIPDLKPTVLWRKIGAGIVFSLIIYISAILFLATLRFPLRMFPSVILMPVEIFDTFRSANQYGLFAVMTHARDEIEFEGSDDGGMTWKTYMYKWQPQQLKVAPRFMAPHLPRFDWNLWFAALGTYKNYPFVIRTAIRLMEGSGPVERLFKSNPFPDKPPGMIRFPLYRYTFTDLKTQRESGNYWWREKIGYYAPTLYVDSSSGTLKMMDPTKEVVV